MCIIRSVYHALFAQLGIHDNDAASMKPTELLVNDAQGFEAVIQRCFNVLHPAQFRQIQELLHDWLKENTSRVFYTLLFILCLICYFGYDSLYGNLLSVFT